MKTLIIYIEEFPEYIVIEGDYSHLNGTMINHYQQDKNLQDEAINLLFEPNSGNRLLTFSEDISIVENKEWDKVALITFLL